MSKNLRSRRELDFSSSRSRRDKSVTRKCGDEMPRWVTGMSAPPTGRWACTGLKFNVCLRGNKLLCCSFSSLIILACISPVPFIPLVESTFQTTNELHCLASQQGREHPSIFRVKCYTTSSMNHCRVSAAWKTKSFHSTSPLWLHKQASGMKGWNLPKREQSPNMCIFAWTSSVAHGSELSQILSGSLKHKRAVPDPCLFSPNPHRRAFRIHEPET